MFTFNDQYLLIYYKQHNLFFFQYFQKAVKKSSKKSLIKVTIDCVEPINDTLFTTNDFEKFLHDRIKVNGKAGQLGSKVTISRDKSKVQVQAELPFSKRYLKYLTKKYLQKKELRNYLRVVATNKQTYQLKYFKVGNDAE